jgi:hypothetical protein
MASGATQKIMANGGRKGLARRSGGLDEHRDRGDSDNGVVREHDPLASRIHCYGLPAVLVGLFEHIGRRAPGTGQLRGSQ